jgi:hypothetical protein
MLGDGAAAIAAAEIAPQKVIKSNQDTHLFLEIREISPFCAMRFPRKSF